MFIEIDFESEIPIYSQLRNEILKGIAKGVLKDQDPLPSVRQLGVDIGINMHTVNKAYNILKQEGLVTVDRRKGAMINLKNRRSKDETFESLKKSLGPIVAEASCFQVDEKEFIELVHQLYQECRREQHE